MMHCANAVAQQRLAITAQRQSHVTGQTRHRLFNVCTSKTSRFSVSRQMVISASATTEDSGPGKLISKVEVPAFIPRADLSDQLLRWAMIEIQSSGVANVGCPCKVRYDSRAWHAWSEEASRECCC